MFSPWRHDYDDNYGRFHCVHGNYGGDCDYCDEIIEERGGIDKCMNCGSYKYGDQLNEHQVCIRPCRNPREY